MGSDGIEYDDFEREFTKNIRGISRRVLTRVYIFHPLVETHRPKPKGGVRVLSISSIRDAIVQRQIYEIVYPEFEKLFSRPSVNYVSFAYRRRFSAPRAIVHVKQNVNSGYVYALDADLSKYFDTIDHSILKSKLEAHLSGNPDILRLLFRFISSDRVPLNTYSRRKKNKHAGLKIFKVIKPRRAKREKGIPQGGMLSGLLANFYLADFDWWVVNKLGSEHNVRYIRYADDFLIMTNDLSALPTIKEKIRDKMIELNLELNIQKTKIINIPEQGIEFLGFNVSEKAIGISDTNSNKFKSRINETLDKIEVKKLIAYPEAKIVRIVCNKINFKILGVSEARCATCNKSTSGRPKSWMSFFSAIDKIQELREIDKWIRKRVYQFLFKNFGIESNRGILKQANLLSLEREYYRIKHIKKCKCALSDNLEVDSQPEASVM